MINFNLKPYIIIIIIIIIIYYLRLGRHPVAGVIFYILQYISTDYKGWLPKSSGREGLHVKHVVATWKYREPSQHLL